ncbi:hypothetical protein JTB14_023474 [Gonioctena quinquepunctata]|nr:hypothetical protein JTB14_023474 [Gonioctena quinquepunctata]
MWCMRFEAKHRVFQHFANAPCDRRTICPTLAIRHQLQLNYIFLKGYQEKKVQLRPEKLIENIATLLEETNCTENDNLMSVSWVEINGLEYRKSSILLFDIPQDEDPIFMQIYNIYVYGKDKRIIFKCSKFSTIGFDEHYFAYEVLSPEQKGFFYRSLDVILSTAPVVHHLINAPNGKDYITCRDYI